MRLHVHRSAEAFLEALRSAEGAYYTTFDRSNASPAVLADVSALARHRSHRELAADPALRQTAERLLCDYFDTAAKSDPDARFAYSSRVLLAVPDYADVELVFLLRALKTERPGSTVHALIEDDWKAGLACFDAHGGAVPEFHAPHTRGLARVVRSVARCVLAPRPATSCDVIVFTLGEALAKGALDSYFGGFASTLASRCKVMSVYLAPGKRLRLRSTTALTPLEAFLKPPDGLRVGLSSPGPRDEAGGRIDILSAYLRAREYASGEVVMLNVMTHAFDRMFAHLKPRTVVYPFENRTWEKRLLRAARRSGVRRCIGYQHSSITPRHLAFRGATAEADLPDTIITCGEVTAAMVREGIPQARSRVVAGAALRAPRLDVAPVSRWAVLVPISSSRAEAWELLQVLHVLALECSVPIIVRTHPAIPIDDLYARFDWPAHVMMSRGRTLAEDLSASALVVYSSSTVALEGMLYGRLPVYVDIGDVPSGDPIQGNHRFVARARTGGELAQAIERIGSLPEADLVLLREEARAYADAYLVDPTPGNVERMAATIFAPC